MKKRTVLFVTIGLLQLVAAGMTHAEYGVLHIGQSVSSSGNFIGTRLAVHPLDGEAALCGYHSGSSIFGGVTLDSGGGASQAFLMRLDTTGGVQWVREIGGPGVQQAHGTAVDGAGNSYVVGESIGDAVVQGGTAADEPLSGNDKYMFLAKYDADGNLVWVRDAHPSGGGAENSVVGESVTVDSAGDVYVVGTFVGAGVWFDTTVEVSGGEGLFNGFIAKYDSNGAIQFARGVTASAGASGARIHGVTIFGADAVMMVGEFAGTVSIGNLDQLSSNSIQSDVLVAVYDTDGTAQWARRAGGDGKDRAWDLAADTAGGVVVAGHSSGSAAFGGKQLAGMGGSDGFVARFDALGDVSWVTAFGGSGDDEARAVAVNSRGRIAVTGEFSATVTAGGQDFTSRGGSDAFFALFDPSGDFVSCITGGGAGTDVGRSAGWRESLLVVAGGFEQAALFGGTHLGTHADLSGGDMFFSILGDGSAWEGIAGDFNGSGRVGLEDAIGILQMLTRQR